MTQANLFDQNKDTQITYTQTEESQAEATRLAGVPVGSKVTLTPDDGKGFRHEVTMPAVPKAEGAAKRAHTRVKGGNVPLRNGIIAFHLNQHDIGDGLQWRRRGSDEAEVFFNENEGDVDWAVHFTACKTKRGIDTLVPSVIGGVCLSAVRDWGGTKVEAETFIEGILENNPRRRKPAMNEVRRYIDAHPVRRNGRQDDELLAVMKDGFGKFINK